MRSPFEGQKQFALVKLEIEKATATEVLCDAQFGEWHEDSKTRISSREEPALVVEKSALPIIWREKREDFANICARVDIASAVSLYYSQSDHPFASEISRWTGDSVAIEILDGSLSSNEMKTSLRVYIQNKE